MKYCVWYLTSTFGTCSDPCLYLPEVNTDSWSQLHTKTLSLECFIFLYSRNQMSLNAQIFSCFKVANLLKLIYCFKSHMYIDELMPSKIFICFLENDIKLISNYCSTSCANSYDMTYFHSTIISFFKKPLCFTSNVSNDNLRSLWTYPDWFVEKLLWEWKIKLDNHLIAIWKLVICKLVFKLK